MTLPFSLVLLAQMMMAGLPIDGIRCDSMEGAAMHVHGHLALYDRGRPVTVPQQIGIPAAGNCLYWVHTHTSDGFIHIESPVKKTFTLGQFFDVWGQELNAATAGPLHASRGRRLTVWVNGKPYRGDPRGIALSKHANIVIQNGPPFAKTKPIDWGTL